ncbi:Anthocyanidin 3-O-glucoside 2'''-O-xylosyltransferase [Vitis vinifera]|uniref:Anthocyanidin 3-O-glucoside 2'''-O-xylosyltransferase n=1 Tax=Vitis vinifera TaxID=29760 RepID=A0A438H4A3_VITVI|nr:Anthocyanidin 3-O-glucoside 2'''-O-xylosyltransferase [Vitis vinifera]
MLPKKAQSQLQTLNFHPTLISFNPLTVPQVEGLPPGAETTAVIPIFLNHLLTIAMDRTADQVEAALRIKSLCYNTVCAPAIAQPWPSLQLAETGQSQLSHPWLPPQKVVFSPHEARLLHFISASFGKRLTFHECIITAMKHCNAISIRICQEIEGPFCDYAASQYAKPVFLTGPVLPEPSLTPLERWAH